MAIGANWAEIWGAVWGPVWTQAPAAASRTITLQLVSAAQGGVPRAGLGGLRWAFFDDASFPGLLLAGPVDSGTAETTDGSGTIVIELPNTSLSAGETGWLILTDSNGAADQDPPSMAFCAPVVIA